MSNHAPQIVQKLWSFCNVLRDDGMSYGGYPSTWPRTGSDQWSYLFRLIMADERTTLFICGPDL